MALIRKSRIRIEGQPAASKHRMDGQWWESTTEKEQPDRQGQADIWTKKVRRTWRCCSLCVHDVHTARANTIDPFSQTI